MIQTPHRRSNPLTGEWVQVSPQRTQRPWQGQVEKASGPGRPAYDPGCYLCPGNTRAGGKQNPAYPSTYVFPNDFPSLLPDTPPETGQEHPLLRRRSAPGECRVICFSPRHDLTLAEMAVEEIRQVIEVWAEQSAELRQRYRWVQVFENKGAIMGCSNPHPHGQIWSLDDLPNEPYKEDLRQHEYYEEYGRPLLLDYVELELEREERVVLSNDGWVAVVPYWATWPFEVLLLPRRPVPALPELEEAGRQALAEILKSLLVRYDNLFQTEFPYSMGWHPAPGLPAGQPHWQLHAHFYPPLLRSATVKKFMVGYEMLAEPQRDLTPEAAAQRLRELPGVHYKEEHGLKAT